MIKISGILLSYNASMYLVLVGSNFIKLKQFCLIKLKCLFSVCFPLNILQISTVQRKIDSYVCVFVCESKIHTYLLSCCCEKAWFPAGVLVV